MDVDINGGWILIPMEMYWSLVKLRLQTRNQTTRVKIERRISQNISVTLVLGPAYRLSGHTNKFNQILDSIVDEL